MTSMLVKGVDEKRHQVEWEDVIVHDNSLTRLILN